MIPRLTPIQRAEWTLTKSHALAFCVFPITIPFIIMAIPFLVIGMALLLPSLVVSKAARRLYDAGCIEWHRARAGMMGGRDV